ncbi:MAG: hypothetical protein ONB48_06510 [candidate division KSB1 bacterium]|nr:hypothetical protein [candidate division KSB1 bacterium]MDZ7273193.1 hypothetical protein [candidate division KSB1 bacterium]MDZ7285295.1 hypothetical protein [candidate division KSB1 bacterium]MDZ7298327.1 hypothetical protein [candidate division KSB1 bacterium]MDZ7349040.1 hypothetical protein [candidate division KSB1 bacterium]
MDRDYLVELAEARQVLGAGNIGRARTCARRAAGMVLRAAIGVGPSPACYAPTFILALHKLASDAAYPPAVREAAGRLVDRSKPDRTSASQNPVQDAEIILKYFGFPLS